jgi:sugar phosphate isomerase/epimerase
MMRLAISNLAIPIEAPLEVLADLRDIGLRGLEIAPTRIASWEALTPSILADYARQISDIGLEVSSLQALLFGTTNLQLLGEETAFDAMSDHLLRVSEIGAGLGAAVGVFGSPRNRLRGDLSLEAAWDLGRERLTKLAEVVGRAGFTLGLEPVPPAYGGDFLIHPAEIIRMVEEVNHPGLGMHLDTGCALLGGDDIAVAIETAGSRLAHFQIAEPKLGGFDAPQSHHAAAAAALRALGYTRWGAIEMLEQPADPIAAIRQAVHFVASTYLFNDADITRS